MSDVRMQLTKEGKIKVIVINTVCSHHFQNRHWKDSSSKTGIGRIQLLRYWKNLLYWYWDNLFLIFFLKDALYLNIHLDVTDYFADLFFKGKIMLLEWNEYLFFDICLVIPSSHPFENQCSGTSGLWSAHSIWTKVCYLYRCITNNK